MALRVTRPQSNGVVSWWGGTGDSHCGCAADECAGTEMLLCKYRIKSLRNGFGRFLGSSDLYLQYIEQEMDWETKERRSVAKAVVWTTDDCIDV